MMKGTCEVQTVEEILEGLRGIMDAAEGRDLTDEEATQYEALETQLAAARRTEQIRARHAAYQAPVPGDLSAAGEPEPAATANPLAFTRQALDQLADATRRRATARVDASTITNATLTTTTYGQPAEWGGNILSGPRILHVVAGVPRQPIDAVLAEFPQLTLPDAAAAASEGSSLTEYDDSTAGSVVLGRFGRWTKLTHEGRFGTTLAPIIGAHTIGIARDLDAALITLVETAAGSPVAFSADVEAAIRKAIAQVIDATAGSVDGLVVLTHPDDAALLQDVTPIGGNTIGEPFQRFSGALVYPSSGVESGLMTVVNLRDGARYFEAAALASATDVESVATDVLTLATAVTAGYAITLAGGFAVQVDVVTG
jgi:hypothetical protein